MKVIHAGDVIKLRIEMGNMSKRQQPDHRVDNSQKATNGSSMQLETPAPGGVLQLANMYTSSVIMDVILNSKLNTLETKQIQSFMSRHYLFKVTLIWNLQQMFIMIKHILHIRPRFQSSLNMEMWVCQRGHNFLPNNIYLL